MEKKTEGLVAQMNRITSSVTAFKVVMVTVVALSLAGVAACYVHFALQLERMYGRVYVISDGAAFEAQASDGSVTRRDEVMDHVMRFHGYVFDIPPEYDMIKRNLEKALVMCDRSVYDYYNDLNEKGFYQRMVNTGSYQQIEVTNVSVDMDVYPYEVVCTGYVYINRPSNISRYVFESRCRAENAVRSSQNLHGIMLTRFVVSRNELEETREKK